MSVICFLVYGDRRDYQLELTYSVLSAERYLREEPVGIRLVLVADERNLRPDLPVENVLVPAERLRRWHLDGQHFHAAKIYAIEHVLDRFDEPILYVDTDTVFHCHPNRIFDRIKPGHSIMHTVEGAISQRREWPEYEALIAKTAGSLAGRKLDRRTMMYNAGVCGLDPADSGCLREIRTVMKDILKCSSVFTAEQLASSIVLAADTKLASSDDTIEHYWSGARDFYRYQMKRIFPGVLVGNGIDSIPRTLPALRAQIRATATNRLLARIKQFRRGNDGAYGFANLACRSAFAASVSDRDLANTWARKALSMLVYGVERPHAELERDFARLLPTELDQLSWMETELREAWREFWGSRASSSQEIQEPPPSAKFDSN